MLGALKDTKTAKSEDSSSSSKVGERDLQVWRRKLDDLKSKSLKKQEHLNGIRDKMTELQKEQKMIERDEKNGKGPSGKDKNPLKLIRLLENRLDKAMIKYNESL